MQDPTEMAPAHLQAALLESRSPAYLRIGPDGILQACLGNLELYGLGSVQPGRSAAEQAAILLGLHEQSHPAALPCVQSPSGRRADIHVIPDSGNTWIVFLDAEPGYQEKLLYQQEASELKLWKQRLEKTAGRAAPAAPENEPEGGEPLAGLFRELDTLVLEVSEDGSIRMLGAAPAWLPRLYPEFASQGNAYALGERFPFLGNFLFDAEEHWGGGSGGRLKSGPWSEASPGGEELFLEASAVTVGSSRLLLVELMGSRYRESQLLLQKARDTRLEEQRRVKEAQKKEILLHCIVHDLAGPLTGIKGCLSLLKFENLTPKGQELLEAGLRQSAKQEKWIRTILEVFSAEVASLESFTRDPSRAPDAAICAREVVQALLPAASAEKLNLQLSPAVDMTQEWKVAGERSRLERVLFNLVENALRHTSPASTVTVRLERSGEHIEVMVDDEGPGISPEAAGGLFQKFSQGEGHTGKAGLGLYFCRITVERWGGEIGCHSLQGRGARFWFRLPAVS